MFDHGLLPRITNTTQIRFASLLTILWFGFVFNVERLELPSIGGALDLSNVLYGTIALMGIVMLAFPNLEKLRILWGGSIMLTLYGLMHLVFSNWRHYHFKVSIVVFEVVVLLISYLLLKQLSHLLLDLEWGLQIFLPPEKSLITPLWKGKESLEQELKLQRVLRVACVYCEVYDKQDTEIQLSKLSSAIGEYIEHALKQQYQRTVFGQSITALTYKSDLVMHYRNGFLIFLLETGQDEVRTFLYDLAVLVRSYMPLNFIVGEAYYPNDGITFEELERHARANIYVLLKNNGNQTHTRTGEVYVDMAQRLKIEQQSAWVNQLAYQSPSARNIYRPIKQMMDIAFTIVLLPFIVPVMLVIMILILLDDGRPIFYSQERTGYAGRRFMMHKFRTMVKDAETIPPTIITDESGEKRYMWPDKQEKDPRITRPGRILRKTSLDELPQLWNVLVGDMSLVGPRPTTWAVGMYTLLQTKRLEAKPGITGLWQVSARESKNFDERLLWDVKYVEKMSLWLDLQIFWRTIAQVMKRGGA